jgi:DNA-binding NtrC family response regulator
MPVKKIMIVDDERLVRWSLRQKCEEWGYTVIEADSGEPGLKLAQHESPDLVLLDVRMPDLSGIEVLDQLKKSGDAPAVIMITADPQLDDVKAALKLGAYDFVGKPIDFDELHITIKNALEATSLRTEVQALRGEVRRVSGHDGGQALPNGRSLPRLYIPEGGTSLEEVEHAMVELAVRQAHGNQTHAAKLLDISRDALRYKLKKFGPIRGDDESVQTSAADER